MINYLTNFLNLLAHIDPRVFPTILIGLDFATAIVWFWNGDARKVIYWIAAGVLSITVTW
ncbi:MAG: hypothetical protein WCS18_05120 [Sphaerochaetaceae bacterium]